MNRSIINKLGPSKKRLILLAVSSLFIFLLYILSHPMGIIKSAVSKDRGLTIQYYDAFVPGSDNIIKEKPPVQRDLAMQLLADPKPERNFHEFLNLLPINLETLNADKKVFSTMFCSRLQHPQDPYFAATQQLIWRILWSPYASKYPFVVFVCPFVGPEYRAVFKGQGAIVRELPLLDILPDDKIGTARWTDQFVKLNLWNQVDYDVIVYLDSDAFPLSNIDGIFDVIQEQTYIKDKLEAADNDIPATYVFAGRPMPINGVDLINGGMLVLRPDAAQFNRLLRNAKRHTEYDISTMEQSFLNSHLGFGKTSPFPAQELPHVWNAGADQWSAIESGALDPSTIKILHEKLWIHNLGINASPKRSIWRDQWLVDWMHMVRFYNDPLWDQMRRHRRKPRDEEERKSWMRNIGIEPYAYAQEWWKPS